MTIVDQFGAKEAEEYIIRSIRFEREYQTTKWGYDHDLHHKNFEWLGLITKYAAEKNYIAAAALCISAALTEN